MPNATSLQSATVALPLLNSVIIVNGTESDPVFNVGFTGFTVTQTRTTFLEIYEGQWGLATSSLSPSRTYALIHTTPYTLSVSP